MEIVDIGKLWSQTPPSEPIGSRNWRAFARCAGEDTEQFYEGLMPTREHHMHKILSIDFAQTVPSFDIA